MKKIIKFLNTNHTKIRKIDPKNEKTDRQTGKQADSQTGRGSCVDR